MEVLSAQATPSTKKETGLTPLRSFDMIQDKWTTYPQAVVKFGLMVGGVSPKILAEQSRAHNHCPP